jgi:hypothetical protein
MCDEAKAPTETLIWTAGMIAQSGVGARDESPVQVAGASLEPFFRQTAVAYFRHASGSRSGLSKTGGVSVRGTIGAHVIVSQNVV